MSNIEVSEAINLFLTGGKLPPVDGSDLTGMSEIPELHPTHLILNELGSAIAPNNTLAYSGDFLSRHDGTTVGGEVLSNTQSTRYPASVIKNKTILRKNIASKSDGGVPPVRLLIKVNGPNKTLNTQLGILQVYACWVNSGQSVPDTGFFDPDSFSINRYDLFNNTASVDSISNVVTNNTVLQMRYEIEGDLLNATQFEATTTKISIPSIPSPSGGGYVTIVGGVQTRTSHSIFDNLTSLVGIELNAGETRDLVVQATIFSHDRLHVGPAFTKGSGVRYNGALWYNTVSNTLLVFSSAAADFVAYQISGNTVPFYYSATEAGATIPAYVPGKYIIFGDKDYYKKGEGGTYVTKYNYLENVTDAVTFDTTLSIITTPA